jgi:long-chain fatty acid transport protein
MYEVNERNRFGLSYHSGMEFTAEGDGSAGEDEFDEVKLNLPAMAEFSGFHQVADAWAVHYSIQWIGWGAFDKIEFGNVVEKEYNWTNSGRYAIGTTYTIGKSWTWRAGLAFDETPVEEEYRSVSIPDSNRIWYSTGATWTTASERHSVDMAFAYIQGEELDVSETASPTPLVVNAKTKTDAIILGLSYNHKF